METRTEQERRPGLYSKPILRNFFEVLTEAVGKENCLHLTNPGSESFALPSEVPQVDVNTYYSALAHKNAEVVVVDLPTFEFEPSMIALSTLSNQGLAFLVTDPRGFWDEGGKETQDNLKKIGFNVLGYIELPIVDWNPGDPRRPTLTILSRQVHRRLFTASISDSVDETVIAHNLVQYDPAVWAESGFASDSSEFRGFRLPRIHSQQRSLLKAESGFHLCRLGDFVSDIQLCRSTRDIDLNEAQVSISLYFKWSSRDVVQVKGDISFGDDRFVITLNDGLLPSYFKMFMNSELGRMCLEVASSESIMPKVETEYLLESQIPIPTLSTQRNLLNAHEKLGKLQNEISILEKELIFNPKNIDTISDDVESLLSSIGRLTAADEIKARVRSGENKTTEFKETFSWDIRGKQKQGYIEEASLKSIAGFLNTEGGTLYIGVHDSGEITGVDFEVRKLHKNSADAFLLYFTAKIRAKFGEQFYPKINWNIETVDGNKVLVVNTEKGQEPAFLDGAFYVRVNPATNKLEGEQLYRYMTQRFNHNSLA